MRGPDYAISMRDHGSTHHVNLTFKGGSGSIYKAIDWCKELLPNAEDVAWGWDFEEGYRLAPAALARYEFWFTKREHATLFRMVWC